MTTKYKPEDFNINNLGPTKIDSPLWLKSEILGRPRLFVDDTKKVAVPILKEDIEAELKKRGELPGLEYAGPRRKIYFDPVKTKCAIVTCGGLCPGINSLIRAIVLELYHNYGNRNIIGIRYGLQGFIPKYGHEVVELTPQVVETIHGRGGNFLGMSRGYQDVVEIVDAIERLNISILFIIGGDGTLRAALKITKEINRRNLKIAVVGIPKTIDNDIPWVDRSFGFDTAVEAATEAIFSAHNEAKAAPNGIGLVKLMGRYSGFVAANATLALTEVNFTLIPEVDFDIDGPRGLLVVLENRLKERGHAVIVVAEGAGQKFFDPDELPRDASGNLKPGDIGTYLKTRITKYFHEKGMEVNLKYIDPSYLIRSIPANAQDRVYCGFLGQRAVHAAMAGKTGMLISRWNNKFVHVPLKLVVKETKVVEPTSGLWQAVLEATGQPSLKN